MDGDSYVEIAEGSWIIPALEITYTKVEAVAPTYTTEGNSEYYIGSDGNYYVMDGDSYVEIAEGSWIIPVLEKNSYTVVWKNEDGSILETDADVLEGSVPSYDGEEPVKASDSENDYFFAGWTPDVAEVSADAVYTATFTSAAHKYGDWITTNEATCTEDGSKIRYCSNCDRFEEDVIPATGHTFVLENGKFRCAACGELYTGLYTEENGDIRYYADGAAIYAGLVQDDNGNYYYIGSDKTAVKDGEYFIGNAKANGLLPAGYYTFDADGKIDFTEPEVKEGLILDDDGEIRFYVNGAATYAGLVQDDNGNYYYIGSDKTAVKDGEYFIGNAKANGLLPAGYYTFDADGKIDFTEPEVKEGLILDDDGEIRFYVNGAATYAGLVQDADGNYYYIGSDKTAVKDGEYFIGNAKANGLLPAGYYTFGADGRIVFIEPKQGVTLDDDGEIRYYVDDVATYAGLVQDADGNYYYFSSAKTAVKNCEYFISNAKANGLLPAGYYTFGADGKIVFPEVKEGLTFDDDGEIRFYVDGVATYAGLVRAADGSYYYINSAKKAVKNCKYSISEAKANGLLPAGSYNFGEDGKMIVG